MGNLLRHFYFILQRFRDTKGFEAAAAIAYYSIVSMFPLMLILIAFNSTVLKSPEIQEKILDYTDQLFPGSRQVVQGNLHQLIASRGTVGILGSMILLWSATGVFVGIAQNINQAWTKAEPRHFLIDRMMALIMIGCLLLLMVASMVLITALNVLPRVLPPEGAKLFAQLSTLTQWLFSLGPILGIFGTFVFLYRWLPNTKVLWREALTGALFATIAWEATKAVFIWYIRGNFTGYQVIYGSLGTLVVLLFWIYIASCIILLGAHLGAAMAHFRHLEETPESEAEARGDIAG